MKRRQAIHSINLVTLYFLLASLLPSCGAAPAQRTLSDALPVSIADGESAIEEGDFKSATEIFAQLINDTPNDPVLHYYFGLANDNMGDATAAISSYQKALALNPDLSNARVNLGLVYYEQKNLNAAIEAFTTVAKAEPDASDVQYNLAMALAAAGKTDDATAHYDKAASLDPEDPDPIIALGNMQKDAGRPDAALTLFEKAASVGAGSGIAVLSAAQVLKEMKKTDQAAEKLMSLVDMDTDTETLTNAGLLLVKMGKPDDAIVVYTHTLKMKPDAVPTRILLGNTLARKGAFSDAAQQFQYIVNNNPNAPEADLAQKGLAACKAKMNP